MADDVTLNTMSGGSVVSTDQAGDGSHVQVVKLAYSADGSRTHVDADTDGLKVNVSNATVTVALGSALPAGSNVIGGVTQSGTWNIGSITTLPALAAGSNVIGGVTQSGSWTVDVGNNPTVFIGNASVPINDNGGTISIDGTVAATQSGAWTVTANAGTGTMAVIERGTTIASGNASVTTSAATILAADATRRTAVLTNLGSDYVWIGDSGITANEGIRLAPGQTLTIDKAPTPAIYAVAQSGTQTVAYFTEAD
ncbi:MAG: hypothetical protein ACO3IN_13885 [Steroidobacteraceae bacterium]